MKKISEVMTPGVHLASPDQTLGDAAKLMAAEDVGSLPVGENDRLVGMVTDRDIVIRGVALGLGAQAQVRDVMTEDIKFCYDDEEVAHVARNMAELGLRRLPVINRDKRLVGMVALSNVAHCGDGKSANDMLRGVARPH
jgi:CBS domain-containing protein